MEPQYCTSNDVGRYLPKQKHCMERSICFTKVADGFGWFAVVVVFLFFLLYNGLFQKKKLRVWLRHIFFGKNPEISRYVTLPLEIPDKTRLQLHSWSFCKVVLATPLKIPEPKTKATGNSNFFLITPGSSTFFLVNSGNSAFYFFDTPRSSMSSTHIPCFFFLEQPNVW